MRTIWRNKTNPHLVAEQAYDCIDRVLVIDESKDRLVIKDLKFSAFDFNDWEINKDILN